jgi:hypothetical protein
MRQADWAYNLGEFVNSIHTTPFAYGVHDCGTLSAGCIKALTGIDAMPSMTYSTAVEAARECQRVCGSPCVDDLVAFLAKQYGWKEVKPTFAHRGDLVVIGGGDQARLGVVSLHGTHIMTPGDKGLLYEPFDRFSQHLTTYHL